MLDNQMLLYGIIHVGASSMSVNIIEYKNLDEMHVIESATREVTFGEEVFQNKILSFESIEDMCRVLKGYKQLMETYGVTEYKVYGTSAIREAENRLFILDRIFIHTGMDVEVVDMPKEIYYKYFALYFYMYKQGHTNVDEAVLFLDITSGGVGITVWKSGSMVFQENVHIGSLRVMERFNRNQRASSSFSNAVGEYLHSMLAGIKDELHAFNIKRLILAGDEAVTIAQLMGVTEELDELLLIKPKQFIDFVNSFNGVTPTKLITHYNMAEHRANIIMPTIILYHEILKMVLVDSLVVSQAGFTQGVSMYYGAEKEQHPYLYMVREQNVQLAESIARRYNVDMEHAKQTERFGLQIFDALRNNGLSDRFGYLYRITAILCDVGKYINLRNHSTHAYHIIMSTDIFGLSEVEKEVVANAVFYQYKGRPSNDDSNFRQLGKVSKIIVAKLVAILRMAHDLDSSRKQKVTHIALRKEDETIIVTASSTEDMSLEKWTFEEDAEFFRTVFGLDIKLEQS